MVVHQLPALHYYLYLAAYNVIYVVPLSIIVLIMTVTVGSRKLTEWQGRQLKLISGLMMFFLGLILGEAFVGVSVFFVLLMGLGLPLFGNARIVRGSVGSRPRCAG